MKFSVAILTLCLVSIFSDVLSFSSYRTENDEEVYKEIHSAIKNGEQNRK